VTKFYGKCYQCQRPGHSAKYCPNGVGGQQSREPPNCYICKKIGHYKKDCRYRLGGNVGGNRGPPAPKKNGKRKKGGHAFITTALVGSELFRGRWVADSGASEHMSGDRDVFEEFKVLSVPIQVMVGGGAVLKGTGFGNVKVNAFDGQEYCDDTLSDVLYVEGLGMNLFSLGSTLKKGFPCKKT